MLKKVAILLCLALWPINLFLNNTTNDFLHYLIPSLIIIVSYVLYKKGKILHLFTILLVGIFEVKLLPIPFIYILFYLYKYKTKAVIVPLLISLLLIAVSFKPFMGQTVFNKDYEAQQLVLRNIQLYPNVFIARLFQNKLRIHLNKVTNNFFTLTDLNNYFFALHPRPIVPNNQNLYKFPFVAIIFFAIGLIYIDKSKDKFFIVAVFSSIVFSLSILQNFDRHDFILYLPCLLLIFNGFNVLEQKNRRIFNLLITLLVLFGIPEVVRGYVEKIY